MAAYREHPPLPMGFAHRGARAEARDNTLPSFHRALELGADALESDAWITADGVVVLDHDGVVRQGVRRRPISTLTADELPSHIPTLRQLWADCGTGFQLSLDVKDPAAAIVVMAEAEEVAAVDRVWLCAPRVELLQRWRTVSDRVRLVLSTRRDVIRPTTPAMLAHLGVDAVNLRDREWNVRLVEEVHRAGLLALGWDAQRTRQLERLMDLGVDGVYSDHVSVMLEVLGRQAK